MIQRADHRGLTRVEHRALKSVAVQFFVNGAVIASYIPRLPEIRDSLGLSLAAIGAVLAVATGVGVVGSLIQGPVIGGIGTRRAMIVASLTLVLGLGLVGLTQSTLMFVGALMVIAIADVVTDVAMNMQGSALSDRRSVPVINRLHGLWSLGTVVGGIVATIAASSGVSLRVHLLIAALVLGFAVLYVGPGLLRSDDDLLHKQNAQAENDSRAGASAVAAIFIALGASAIIPEVITSDWAAFRLSDDLDVGNGVAGLGFVAFTTGMVLGRFSADSIVAQHGSTKVLRVATALTAVGVLCSMIVPFVGAAIVGLVITGLGVSVMFPQIYDQAARSEHSKGALGGLTAGSRIALLVTPVVVGGLAGTESLTVGQAVAAVTIPAAIAVLALSVRFAPPTNS